MNIKEAKDYIKDTVKLYLKKDRYGEYRIPVVRQRPIFLLGAPGIGKTAIMEQVSQELGIALVSYSMTHHTRQSALGLPFIEHKNYAGEEFSVSEYTMSEIIASVYETMEKSGIREGILFLDEINCVSETLAPSMLQFLQYKVFGRHSVPDGWVIVTAGNPPEYNRSVREFDVVTLDRLKILTVEADYQAWKIYARNRNIHGAVRGYLDLNKDDFYIIETISSGKSYVTARGWEDLSQILYLYEEEGLEVKEELVGQYLKNDRVVREFTAYYDLYNKYKNDYKVELIVDGDASRETIDKAAQAPFDEKISLLGLLVSYIQNEMKDIVINANVLKTVAPLLKAINEKTSEEQRTVIGNGIETRRKKTDSLKAAGALSEEEKLESKLMIQIYEKCLEMVDIKSVFGEEKSKLMNYVNREKQHLHNSFLFIEEAFGQENEMLIFLTELTADASCAAFLSKFGSEDYNSYSKLMIMDDRRAQLLEEIDRLLDL